MSKRSSIQECDLPDSFLQYAPHLQGQQQNTTMHSLPNDPNSSCPQQVDDSFFPASFFDHSSSERAPERYGAEAGYMPAHSTPIHSPPRHEDLGSRIDFDVSCPASTGDDSTHYYQLPSHDRSMDRYSTFRNGMPAHSTAIGSLPGMPAQSTAIGSLPGMHESFGSPIPGPRAHESMPSHSTPKGPLPSMHESFGSPIPPCPQRSQGYTSSSPRTSDLHSRGFSSSPKSADFMGGSRYSSSSPQSCECGQYSGSSPRSSDFRESSRRHGSSSPDPSRRQGSTSSPKSSDLLDHSASHRQKSQASKCSCASKSRGKEDSFLEKFDKSVEKELERYRQSMSGDANLSLSIPVMIGISDSRGLDSATSSVEIISKMKGEQDTELTEAVEKLAKAEAAVLFHGAIEAAEEAAANAPPEFAEEAAAAGARAHAQMYQAELTGVVKESVPGIRPIEIVGYVGVTRPRRPKKPR